MTLPIEQDSHDFYPGVKDGKEWVQIVAEDSAPPPANDQEALQRLAKFAQLHIEQLITHYLHLPTKRAAKRAHIALSARDFDVDEPYTFSAKGDCESAHGLFPRNPPSSSSARFSPRSPRRTAVSMVAGKLISGPKNSGPTIANAAGGKRQCLTIVMQSTAIGTVARLDVEHEINHFLHTAHRGCRGTSERSH